MARRLSKQRLFLTSKMINIMKRSSGGKSKKNKMTKATSAGQETVPPPTQVEEDKPFDFGGIPSRDLKKNLGCG
jgi:hypothetical protein